MTQPQPQTPQAELDENLNQAYNLALNLAAALDYITGPLHQQLAAGDETQQGMADTIAYLQDTAAPDTIRQLTSTIKAAWELVTDTMTAAGEATTVDAPTFTEPADVAPADTPEGAPAATTADTGDTPANTPEEPADATGDTTTPEDHQ